MATFGLGSLFSWLFTFCRMTAVGAQLWTLLFGTQ